MWKKLKNKNLLSHPLIDTCSLQLYGQLSWMDSTKQFPNVETEGHIDRLSTQVPSTQNKI